MDKRNDAIALIALSVAILGVIGPSVVDDFSRWITVPFAVLAIAMIIYGVFRSGYLIDLLPSEMARILLRQPPLSSVSKYDVTLNIRLRWQDDTGKPTVAVDNGQVTSVWAALNIEKRNYGSVPVRVSELYLEARTGRFPRRLIDIADPTSIDGDDRWGQRDFPRRVEWLLDPASPAITHYVRFSRGWKPDDPSAPRDPKRFSAIVVAELGSPDRRLRIDLGEDIIS